MEQKGKVKQLVEKIEKEEMRHKTPSENAKNMSEKLRDYPQSDQHAPKKNNTRGRKIAVGMGKKEEDKKLRMKQQHNPVKL